MPASERLSSGSRAAKLALACATPNVVSCAVRYAIVVRNAMSPRPTAPSARAVISTLTNESSATARFVP